MGEAREARREGEAFYVINFNLIFHKLSILAEMEMIKNFVKLIVLTTFFETFKVSPAVQTPLNQF